MALLTPPLRFGIIGYGHFAERAIAPAILSARHAELVAISKRSREEAESAARLLGIPHAFDRVEDLVACPDVDAVFVVSANARHAADTICAARGGKHVIVEKPMAMNARECEEMIATCRASDVRLMVGYMVRLSPAVRLVRERIQSGAIGRVTFVHAQFAFDGRNSPRPWLTDRRLAGGGPLFDIAVHCLDTVRFVLGEEVVGVQAAFQPRPTEERTEQTSHLTLRFASGLLGSIYTSFEVGVRGTRLQVMGTEGTLVLEDFTRGTVETSVRMVRVNPGGADEVSVQPVSVPNLYVEEIERFAESVLDGTPIPIPAEEGLENQRVVDAAMRYLEDVQPF
jgi:predicted dehydrogenase